MRKKGQAGARRHAGLVYLMTVPTRIPRATIDFETRSKADLEKIGAYLYSLDPSTEILCLSYHLPGMDARRVMAWHCGHPDIGITASPIHALYPLFQWIKAGGKVEAHNCFFEECIWENVAVRKLKWPKVAADQWMDSAAKAAAHSLPRGLGEAGAALNLPIQKDARGKALIRKFSKPKRLSKFEKELYGADAIVFHEDVEGLHDYWEYNKTDTRSEVRLSDTIPDLSPTEYRVWQITQAMNRRGVLIDIDLCHAALDLVKQARAKLNGELEQITGIPKGSQRALCKEWLEENEKLFLPDTKAKTIEWYLERYTEPLSKRARRVIEIMREVNRTSPNKYKRMLQCVDEEGRARELLVYCGAERTGRFAGRGIQIHNLPKGKLPKGISMDTACADVKTRDLASGIFGRKITKKTAKVITTTGATERDFGKVAVLGLGYGMGYIKFLLTLRDSKIYLTRAEVIKMMGARRFAEFEKKVRRKLDPNRAHYKDANKFNAASREAKVQRRRLLDERENPDKIMHELALCLYTVGAYRSRYPEVPQMWKDQEAAAIKAVRTNRPVKCGKVTWFVKGRFLKCRLPSGRCLNYCDPEIKFQKTSWGESRPGLRFMGRDQKTKRWVRQGTYGGKLTENITQATARDIMALAKITIDDHFDYDLLLSVHDEIISEVDEGCGAETDFRKMMIELPPAFAGCPIDAEPKRYKRYRK